MFFLITNNIFMTSFIYFIIYSFIGFIIETIYTLLTKGVFKMKKCFMLNFLCPVYGVGALLILYTTRKFRKKKLLTSLIGCVVATATELLFGLFYTEFLNAQVWDYSDVALNLNGHISLLFSIFWSVLSILLVYVIHPFLEKNLKINRIPKPILYISMIFLSIDFIFSCFFMKKFKTSKALSISWLINH